MDQRTTKPRRHIHYGRVLTLLLLCGILLYGIGRIIRNRTDRQTSIGTDAPFATGEPVPFAVQTDSGSQTSPVATEALTEPTMGFVYVPDSITLDVPYISQKGLLPTGCELISAKMMLEFYGVETTVNDIIDNTRSAYPKTINGKSYGYSPYEAFIGSPWDESSFGCYPPVITDMMNALLPEDKIAKDITGMELSEIAETYLPRNMPVLVWATISMLETYPNIGWYLLDENGEPTDEWYDWKANEHCLVLIGYDRDYYYFNDPYEGRGVVYYRRELVETRFEEIGSCAVVVVDR